ncbi:hypothetical protein HYH02_012688 [Chlamydomonas schloesseri]|uniref:START domain-containing protein n=1 Tax=Chlamydomonas schloesseri TaxID=2026947 RepID=A0A835W2G3_9CHLO|nr:hypothetical protein HYH02_012688 [Chlamydomonas schloesseri]|eukprot:KAG2433571.1 hypothetical protein HYH02_012688 [Chlamydomonas schloesseri]
MTPTERQSGGRREALSGSRRMGLTAVCALALGASAACSSSVVSWAAIVGSLFESLSQVPASTYIVALVGLILYPALSIQRRPAPSGGLANAAASAQDSTRTCGPGSHFINLGRQGDERGQARGGGFWRKLRRVLAEGRAQARRLCGREAGAGATLTRKRSLGSRSSAKSEDVLSSRLSMDSILRAAQQNPGGGGGRRMGGGLQRKGSWKPSMRRIESGQHLAGIAPSESSLGSVATGRRLEILMHNGFLAVDCLPHEMTEPGYEGVRQVVTDMHLLQFGATIGEASSELALSQQGGAPAVGPGDESLFGLFDRKDAYRQGWELIVEEHKPGLHYFVWRRYLRKGLFIYKSKTVYETATVAQITGFTYDLDFRRVWDESMACQLPIAPPADVAGDHGSGVPSMTPAVAEAKAAGGRSAFMYARTKFPPPMASREYTYVRRCWAKPDDGGSYCISRACVAVPPAGVTGGRTVRVTDFVSGYVIRASKGVFDTASPAVEVVNVYFEDPCLPSGIANMGIRRALWPMVQKAEAAFRDFLLTKVHGGLEQPPPERAALDSLDEAMNAAGAQARAAAAAADADAASCINAMDAGRGHLGLRLGSPYVLMYRGYMGAWRGGRTALLSVLSTLMSLWANATGLFVCALGGLRAGMFATAAWMRRAVGNVGGAACKSGSSSAGKLRAAARVLWRVMWPWEMLLARKRSGACSASNGTTSQLQRSLSESSSLLASHPLPPAADGGAVNGVSRTPRSSCSGALGTDGSQSPKNGRRARGGLGRLIVKVVKVAGAGLLLGRAARSDGGADAPPPASQGPKKPHQTQSQVTASASSQNRAVHPLAAMPRGPVPMSRVPRRW